MHHRQRRVALTELNPMNYKVITDRLAGHEPGDTITEADLEGANIDALIEAGHISKNTPKKKEEE